MLSSTRPLTATNRLPTKVKDVYIKLEKEIGRRDCVSGRAKGVSPLAPTHYNMIGFGSARVMGENRILL